MLAAVAVGGCGCGCSLFSLPAAGGLSIRPPPPHHDRVLFYCIEGVHAEDVDGDATIIDL